MSIKHLIAFFWIVLAGVCWGQQSPVRAYPLIKIGGDGFLPKIFAGWEEAEVSFVFKDPAVEELYLELRAEIRFAGQYMDSPPMMWLEGTLSKDRKILTVENWFLMTPFLEINSLAEVIFDPALTKTRVDLKPEDFRSDTQELAKSRDLSRHLKSFAPFK